MNKESIITRPQGLGITLRTALLSWLVTISTLLLFIVVIIPQQKRIFLENLKSKAHSVALSLQEVGAGAAVNEDYPSVVDHCKDMLAGDEELDYIMVTKNDGFSVRFDRLGGWRAETLADITWYPEKREAVSGIGVVPLFNRRLFHYSQPFDYSNIPWGWIHVGLSLKSYDRNVAIVYHRTGLLAISCIFLSLLASVLYAKQLVRPILNLRNVVKKVAGGDLSARAVIESGDELGSLASSVNAMTEALRHRDKILQTVRFAAQQFLTTPNWETVIPEVLANIGKAASVSRVCVFENHANTGSPGLTSQRFVWNDNGVPSHSTNPELQFFSWSRTGLTHWAEQLQRAECVAVSTPGWTPPERAVLESLGICSVLLIPIRAENVWWGFLGLDECLCAREWTEAERDSLRAAADMLGAAISRQRTQDALLRAKEAAEAASLAKSQFLANMSHEIRTPITGVMGMLQLLQRTALDEKQRRYVSNTLNSANALLTVIGDVLDFSKIEAGKLELKETVFSPPDSLETAVGSLAEKAETKKLEVACRLAPEVPRQLLGDPNRLRQVLLNLLSNAIKFTEQGTVLVTCTVAETNHESTLLRFEVQDSGDGIAPEQQALIFEAFCQADNSMNRAHGGTGLGLTISRQLVRLMDGEIGVQSVPGKGSTFWFTARFKNAFPADQAPAARGLADLRGLRVLVVDDCQGVREILCDYVRAWSGEPEAAADAATGLEKLRQAAAQGAPFAVAVIDWHMPGLDGLDLARLIQQDPALSVTRLVLLGSFSQANLSEESKSAGFVAGVPKPVRQAEFHDAIIQAANQKSPPPVRRPAQPPLPAGEILKATGAGTILLAEDNEINQEVASEMVAALGYRCVHVRTGREAVALAQQGMADLVLMDCQMPEMDGYEATRNIRRWEQQSAPEAGRKARLPIVALTAHAMIGDRSRCLEAGMDDYLTKPLEPGTLARTLAQWMPASPVVVDIPEKTAGPVLIQGGINYSSLLHRCMGKQELARRLVQKFLEQVSADALELDAAIHQQDAVRVSLVAHRIKGSAANVSADAVRECADRLEHAGREKELASAPALQAQLRGLLADLKVPAA